jgi:hypothetical protein
MIHVAASGERLRMIDVRPKQARRARKDRP